LIKRTLILIFIIFIISFISFYFWGSSATLDETEYHTIQLFDANPEFIPSDTISIMSYNIGYFSGMTNNTTMKRTEPFFLGNQQTVETLFKNINPDIVAFQEIDYDADRSFNTNQFEIIAEMNTYPFGAKSINWDMNYVPFPYFPFSAHFGKVISGQAILSQYPILNTSAFKFEKPESNPFYYNQFYIDRLLQFAEIKVSPSQSILVINVHLEAYKRKDREKQMDVFIDVVKPHFDGQPIILIGDFNSQIDAKKDQTMVKFLAEFPVREAAMDSLGNLPEGIGTYSTENPRKKIDHIFYTYDSIEMIDWSIPTEHVGASDHLPMVMRFRLK
jgi:endonuclease/exonuclease/phosphatase family metal-dependent hydrolase